MKNEYPLSVCAGEIDVSHTMEREFSGKGTGSMGLKTVIETSTTPRYTWYAH